MTAAAALPPVPADVDTQEPPLGLAAEEWQLVQVRDAVAQLIALGREADQVKQAAAQIAERYKEHLAHLDERMDTLRSSLQGVLERGPHGNKLTFPDTGRINLSTTGGNLKLVDQEAAVSEYGFRFTRPVCDVAAMNTWARDYNKESGQVPTGYEVQPQRKTLVLTPL